MKQHHHITVVGTSMGGLEALQRLLRDLPATLPAALFVVWHVAPPSPRTLGDILERAGALPAHLAADAEIIRHGQVYVAPPDYHLILNGNIVCLNRGPRKNRTRPAIDPLFRSAAVSYRSRVIGLVLTGTLDDGAAGSRAVERCGGITVVQDPAEAAHAEMPQHALQACLSSLVATLAEMPALLQRLVEQPAGEDTEVPEDLYLEAQLMEKIRDDTEAMDRLGKRTEFSCPDCGGALWELRSDSLPRFRCHIGHAYSEATLMDGQAESIEYSLVTALRTMEDRIKVLDRLASHDRAAAGGSSDRHYHQQSAELKQHAHRIRHFILGKAEQDLK